MFSTLVNLFPSSYIYANPCLLDVSGVGWGILLCKDFGTKEMEEGVTIALYIMFNCYNTIAFMVFLHWIIFLVFVWKYFKFELMNIIDGVAIVKKGPPGKVNMLQISETCVIGKHSQLWFSKVIVAYFPHQVYFYCTFCAQFLS